jgi:hypothetical protein
MECYYQGVDETGEKLMGYLYICDASDKFALANDVPNIRAFLEVTPNLFENEVQPITITEIDNA